MTAYRYPAPITPRFHSQAERVREAELQERRLLAARVVLSGRSWVAHEEDPFDGMSPKQIVDFIKKHNIDPSDPFEVHGLVDGHGWGGVG